MSDPYRPQGPAIDPELARLAAQGQQLRRQAVSSQMAVGSEHMRVAIGAYRGSPMKRAVLIGMIASGGVVALTCVAAMVGLIGPAIVGVSGVAFMIGFAGIFALAFLPPIPSQAGIAAEQEWAARQPFQLVGYFETLASPPMPARSVSYDLVWQEGVMPPDPAFLQSVVAAVDPQAQVVGVDHQGARIVSGAISGVTGIRVNGRSVFRNHRMCAAIHRVVEGALWPLQRSFPMERVVMGG